MKIPKKTRKQSIYKSQDPQVGAVFERAGSACKVLCVALDYAKSKHVALCCDGNGDILKKPFPVENNAAGIAYLCREVAATAKRRKIDKKCILFGGEDEASYVANFTSALRKKGYLVARVSAREAKDNRENLLASTDNLDLLGVAKTLLARRARVNGTDGSDATETYHQLRELCRTRRGLVRGQTAASNRIHATADQLFPGFLNASKSGLTPFCSASLALMAERFSAPEFARRRPAGLAATLRRHKHRHPEETAAKLIELGRNALPPEPGRIPAMQKTLAAAADLYACLGRNGSNLRADAAEMLAATPYVMLTSIPGIGFILAAGIAGELGNPACLPRTDSLCAYAGVVPRTFRGRRPRQPRRPRKHRQ